MPTLATTPTSGAPPSRSGKTLTIQQKVLRIQAEVTQQNLIVCVVTVPHSLPVLSLLFAHECNTLVFPKKRRCRRQRSSRGHGTFV